MPVEEGLDFGYSRLAALERVRDPLIGAGTLISPIIKIVTTVAILAAVYVFIVKPVLDTTENVADGFDISESIGTVEGIGPAIQKQVRQAAKLQDDAAQASQAQVDRANKLLSCIADANNDVTTIQNCHEKYQP
jgi:type II secretory pathway component PulM